jgi:hypothetical protein
MTGHAQPRGFHTDRKNERNRESQIYYNYPCFCIIPAFSPLDFSHTNQLHAINQGKVMLCSTIQLTIGVPSYYPYTVII